MNRDLFKRGLIYFIIIIVFVYIFSFGFSFIFGKSLININQGKIGLLELKGIITSSSEFIEQLKRFKNDDVIKAIVIRIDSPGGGVVPAQEIYSEILKLKEETDKKIVVSFGNIGASGGYYIACAADKIVANPGTITGSIGVIMKIPNFQGLFQKIGYNEQVIKSGKLKDIGSISRSLSEKERKILEDMAKDVHEQFIEAVSKTRNLELESIREFSDGRIFSGRRAKDLHLVDELGSIEDAIELAAKMVGLSKKAKVVKAKKDRSFFDLAEDFIGQKFLLNPFGWSPLKIQYILY